MIRLSKKGWNNVLIFSMLIMIMMFHGMHKKLGGDLAGAEVSLLPQNSLLLTLQFPQAAVERIGQSWRVQPVVGLEGLDRVGLDSQQLDGLMQLWLSQTAQWQKDDNEAKLLTEGIMPAYFVIATLAGKNEGAVYAFYPQLDVLLIHDQMQQRWLKASIEVIDQLIPAPLRAISQQ